MWGSLDSAPNWRSQAKRSLDLFDLKGALQCVIPNLSFRSGQFPDFAVAVDICYADERIGFGGQLVASKSNAPGPVLVAELNADRFLDRVASAKKFRELDRYPSITRDIAMIVPEKLSHVEILRAMQEPAEPLLESVQLFDLFGIGKDVTGTASGKSLAYRLTYRAKNRTLTNEEVTKAHAKIRERLKSELGATLRE